MARAFVYAHAGVLCPNCNCLLPVVSPILPEDERVVVACANPRCAEHGRYKTYKRETVELIDR